MVQPWMVEEVKPLSNDYVEVVSSKGLPQLLTSRSSHRPVTITMRADLGGGKKAYNNYYPSPQMHQVAFDALLPSCRQLNQNQV